MRRRIGLVMLRERFSGRISAWLDAWAARRTLDALVRKTNNVKNVRWLGKPVWQYPLDAWLLQEVISELSPDLIVEFGTFQGGSAFFFASLCELLGHGRVLSIDVAPRSTVPHERIEYLTGSSTAEPIIAAVRARIDRLDAKRLLFVLDSDHSAAHVHAELEAYAPLVPVGCYLHVQDGLLDYLPRFRWLRPGPAAAVAEFLGQHPEFECDLDLEGRYVMSAHVHGWLRRLPLAAVPDQRD
jgi:cephalosporin hydroxylase